MKPWMLLVFTCLCCAYTAVGQSFELKGKVRDESDQAVPFASVFLLNASDSTLVKGTSADENGSFKMDNIQQGLYLLNASYIGWMSKSTVLDISKDITIGAIIIAQQAEELDEVVVTTTRPKVEKLVDRLVFNVENTVLSQSSSWDILKQTPGVIVMQDELQIRNQPATVYINDRKVQLSAEEVRNLLENYQGANIKSVEVISNPPARYDAEGGAVLNILTSKNISLGYKGNINTTFTQGIFSKYNFGTSHFYKTEKLNLNLSYSFAPRKDFEDLQEAVNFIDDTGIFSTWLSDFDQTSRLRTHVAGLVLDYQWDDRNELNITSNVQLSPYREYDNRQNTVMLNRLNAVDSTFATLSPESEVKNNVSGDITYKHGFKENGSLRINAHYTKFDLSRDQSVTSNYFDPNGSFIRDFSFVTDAQQDIDIATAQIDYAALYGGTNIEAGVKGSFIASESILDYFLANDGLVPDPNLSDSFQYDENVYAAYASASHDWERWSVKAGLRAEHTQSTGTSVALAAINNLEYFELFPSFYLLHNSNENHSFSFDYSRKLRRPRYEDLNPFRTFINENNFVEGNPNLLPNFSNNFNLNYTLNQEFFFDFYYRDNGNFISRLSFQDNENRILRDITQNVLESTSFGFDFNYGKSITNNWYFYSYISIFHEDETFLALESDNATFKNEFNGVYADITNYLTLSKDGSFQGEIGLTYLSGFLTGSYIMEETTNLTFGVRKSLWKNRALVSLAVNDVLGKANAQVSSRYLNQDNRYLLVPETQYVRFGFTYNFGNFRLTDNDRNIDKIERDRLGTD